MNTKDTLKAIFQTSDRLKPDEIKRYLEDKTSQEERFRVENQLLDDPFAADAVEGFQSYGGDLPDFSFDDFIKKVDPVVEPSAKVVNLPKRSFQLRRIAAAVVFLVAAGLSMFFWSNNDQRLYSQFYEKYDSSDAFISLRDDSSANINDAELIAGLEAYDKGDYLKSIKLFEEFLATNPSSSDALFYAGLSHVELSNVDAGVRFLMQARTADLNYYREATWYSALAYLKDKNNAEAKKLVEELLKSKGRYFKKAEMLNSKL